jgi:two-component system LytT family response regulator
MDVIIIDDEDKSRLTLRNFLEKYTSGINILAEAESVETGIKTLNQYQPDVVFLDIEMKDGTGFDLLNLLKPISFKVVFITAFDHYALKAFSFSATDYLLKPIDPARLIATVNRLKNDTRQDLFQKKLEVLLDNRNNYKKIALPSVDGLVMVKLSEIIRCESEINYTRFYLRDGETYLATKTLKEYEDMLMEMNFCRIHKSHLINLDYVLRYIKGEGGTVILDDHTELEVARRRKEGLINALKNK